MDEDHCSSFGALADAAMLLPLLNHRTQTWLIDELAIEPRRFLEKNNLIPELSRSQLQTITASLSGADWIIIALLVRLFGKHLSAVETIREIELEIECKGSGSN